AAKTPCLNWFGKAFDVQRAGVDAIQPLRECAICIIRHQDLARLGGVCKARCEVCRVTSHGVLAVCRTAGSAGDDLAASDADMDADRAVDMSRYLRDRGLNSQCSARGTLGIVVVRNRRTEDCHHAVANVPGDMSAMVLDNTVHAIEELLEQGVDLFSIEPLPPLRVAGEIGKQHRHLATLANRV